MRCFEQIASDQLQFAGKDEFSLPTEFYFFLGNFWGLGNSFFLQFLGQVGFGDRVPGKVFLGCGVTSPWVGYGDDCGVKGSGWRRGTP